METEKKEFLDLFGGFTQFETQPSETKEEEKKENKKEDEVIDVTQTSLDKVEEKIVEDIVDLTKSKTEDKTEEPTTEVAAEIESLIENISDVLDVDEEKEYDASIEGLKQILIDTKDNAQKKALENVKKSLGEKEKSLFDALIAGNTIDEYLKGTIKISYSEIPIENADGSPILKNQRNLIEDWLILQGLEAEEIAERIADYEAAGLLSKEAKLAKRKLAEAQEKEEAAQTLELKKQADAKIEADKAQAAKFKETVLNTTEVAGFKISKEEAAKLYDYITKPVNKKGETKFMQDDTEQNRLLYAYFAMSGFDKEKLSREVTKKATVNLRKALSNYNDQNTKGKSAEGMRRSTDATPKIYWPDFK